MEYGFKSGARFKKSSPKEVAGYLQKIQAEHDGKLKPEYVVEKARDPKSLLHSAFEWNDGIAAEKYRLEQARAIIRSVTFQIDHTEPQVETFEVRAFLAVTSEDDDNKVYYDTRQVMNEEQWRKEVIKTALGELKAFRRKYASLKEFAAVMKGIKKTEEELNNG